MARIKDALARDLPLSVLFESATIEHLAHVLRQQPQTISWSPLVGIQPNGSKPPLYCVHPIGGHVLCYISVARHLDREQPLWGLQARGLVEHQVPSTSITDMAEEYLAAMRARQPHGPYRLAGWSFGGVVAFEMAQQLCRQGQEVESLTLLDSRAPLVDSADTGLDEAKLKRRFISDLVALSGHDPAAIMADYRRLGVDAALHDVLDQPWMKRIIPPDADTVYIQRLYEVFAANSRAMRGYVPATVYPGRIFVLCARDTVSAQRAKSAALGWEAHASEVTYLTVPGNHYSMLTSPQVANLATALTDCLERRSG
jgi:thioesterase domain-containing protein